MSQTVQLWLDHSCGPDHTRGLNTNMAHNNFLLFCTGHFQGVCVLFCEFLSNVKVTDYSTTEITTSAVQDLMVAMETEILVPLLQRYKEAKEV